MVERPIGSSEKKVRGGKFFANIVGAILLAHGASALLGPAVTDYENGNDRNGTIHAAEGTMEMGIGIFVLAKNHLRKA